MVGKILVISPNQQSSQRPPHTGSLPRIARGTTYTYDKGDTSPRGMANCRHTTSPSGSYLLLSRHESAAHFLSSLRKAQVMKTVDLPTAAWVRKVARKTWPLPHVSVLMWSGNRDRKALARSKVTEVTRHTTDACRCPANALS